MSEDGGLTPVEFGVVFKKFMDAMTTEAGKEANPFVERLRAHLGSDPARTPIVGEEFESYEHPNVQVALDAVLGKAGRRAEAVGVAMAQKRFGMQTYSDLLGMTAAGWGPPLREGPVDYTTFHLEDDRTIACVQFGLYLVSDGAERYVIFVVGAPDPGMGPRAGMRGRLEVVCARREAAAALLREITMTRRERNVYRGKVISLAPGQFGVQALVRFHRLPRVARDDIVFPAGMLERIERQAVDFSAVAPALLAAKRSLKRGILLFGPPGTGKTLTVMYLAGRMPERTVILTGGPGLGLLRDIGVFARELAPSMVVVEDVDLIAQERGFPGQPVQPLLFELLNQLDGLAEDVDVLFVLTTNRPDILEPALAARPGRVDLVVELPLPDAEGRRRLLELYGRGIPLDGVDLGRYVERTDGASPAYIKELLRKAALLAAIDTKGEVARVRDEHLTRAMDELAAGGELAKRIVGFGSSGYLPPSPSVGPMRPAGFPAFSSEARRTSG
jgi:hypothetical protein